MAEIELSMSPVSDWSLLPSPLNINMIRAAASQPTVSDC